jgi:hypothetical protein
MNPQFGIFLLLVTCILIGWGVWYFTTRPKIEKFEAESEPAADKFDCKTYNLRQEVINIFELFIDRKPTVEEIQKYSILGNEQDIFISIMKDFQLAASTKRKDELDAMRVDACAKSLPDLSLVPPENTQPKFKPAVETYSDEVVISKTEYKKLKSAFESFDKLVSDVKN